MAQAYSADLPSPAEPTSPKQPRLRRLKAGYAKAGAAACYSAKRRFLLCEAAYSAEAAAKAGRYAALALRSRYAGRSRGRSKVAAKHESAAKAGPPAAER